MNPACVGQGPAYEPSNPFKGAQLGVAIYFVLYFIITAALTLFMRRHRRRLRARGTVQSILVGVVGSVVILLIRTSFNYAGRQYLPCTVDVLMYYALV